MSSVLCSTATMFLLIYVPGSIQFILWKLLECNYAQKMEESTQEVPEAITVKEIKKKPFLLIFLEDIFVSENQLEELFFW